MEHLETQFGFVVDISVWLGFPVMAGVVVWVATRFLSATGGRRGPWWKVGVRLAAVALAVLGGAWTAWNFDPGIPSTDYAAGYTRQKFNRVQVGDSEAQVRVLLGAPLNYYEYKTSVVMHYSWPRTTAPPGVGNYNNNHWRRAIILDPESRHVVEKWCQFRYVFD